MAGSCECRLESAPLPPPEENKEEEECADDKDSEVADGWRVRKARGFLSGGSALKYKREKRDYRYQTFLLRFLGSPIRAASTLASSHVLRCDTEQLGNIVP